MYEILIATSPGRGSKVGYLIVKNIPGKTPKIDGSNLYSLDEAQEAVDRVNSLNEAEAIKGNWPEQNDPDVLELLNDSSFEPDGATYTSSVIDEDNSTIYTYLDDDEYQQIDWDKSDIVYKDIQLDSPVSTIQRIHKAQEIIARKRAGVES